MPFKKPDAYKNITSSSSVKVKEVDKNTGYLNDLINTFKNLFLSF